jgi:hypothetical protein
MWPPSIRENRYRKRLKSKLYGKYSEDFDVMRFCAVAIKRKLAYLWPVFQIFIDFRKGSKSGGNYYTIFSMK